VATLGQHVGWAFIGSFVISFGFNVWVPPTFALSAESFPTRLRSAGFGLVDGLGVTGGAVGVLVVAAVIAQFTPRARNRSLEVLSP
jgi:putative MFS transporter